jgi:hypothetical protein
VTSLLPGHRDYSQAGEQAAILEWSAPHHGSFLDLGAYDGELFSNTAGLADRGWPGICVDAAPDAVAACGRRYADRPDVAVVHAAFATVDGEDMVTIHWTPGFMYSGVRANERDDVQLQPIEVPRLDLVWLKTRLASLPQPLFCSIDLEGDSLDALSWLLDNAELACVCVEANNPADRATVRDILADWKEFALPDNPWNLVLSR